MAGYTNPEVFLDTESSKYWQNLQNTISGTFASVMERKQKHQDEIKKALEKTNEKNKRDQEELNGKNAKFLTGVNKLNQLDSGFGMAYTTDVISGYSNGELDLIKGTAPDPLAINIKNTALIGSVDQFITGLSTQVNVVEDHRRISNIPANNPGGYYTGATLKDATENNQFNDRIIALNVMSKLDKNGTKTPKLLPIEKDGKIMGYKTGWSFKSGVNTKQPPMEIMDDDLKNLWESGGYVPTVPDVEKNGSYNSIRTAVPTLFAIKTAPTKEGGNKVIWDSENNMGINSESPYLITSGKMPTTGPDARFDYFYSTKKLNLAEAAKDTALRAASDAEALVLMKGHSGIDAVAFNNTVINKTAAQQKNAKDILPELKLSGVLYNDEETFDDEKTVTAFKDDYYKVFLSRLPVADIKVGEVQHMIKPEYASKSNSSSNEGALTPNKQLQLDQEAAQLKKSQAQLSANMIKNTAPVMSKNNKSRISWDPEAKVWRVWTYDGKWNLDVGQPTYRSKTQAAKLIGIEKPKV